MRSLLEKKWIIKTETKTLPLIQRISKHRDIDTTKELQEMHSPLLLKNMENAVKRVIKAIDRKERIIVYGDYDVDGVSGASILYMGLKDCGAEISVRLPHREKDGYGIQKKIYDECKKLKVSLVITVDCGISNAEEVEYGNNEEIETIITDHHSISNEIPKAYAVINPKQKDCSYPDENICGAVVAFKLLQGISEEMNKDIDIQKYIDIAALATVADCMPLTGENRLIVKKGLRQFERTKHRGLRTLLESYDLSGKPLNSYNLGFQIAPCINAAGRLDDPLIALKMMLGDMEKSKELRNINQERQDIVTQALEEIMMYIKKEEENNIIIIWNEKWKAGIIGLLAGKLCEKYHKPVICLTKIEGKYVGSCRSISEINIVEKLQECGEIFINYGGHAQAAGLSISEDKLMIFKQIMTKKINEWTINHPIEAKLYIDSEIYEKEITQENYREISLLEPFGMGNPKPKLLIKNIEIIQSRVVGKNRSHLQLTLKSNNNTHKAIAFNLAEQKTTLIKWRNIDLVCQLNKNEFRGKTSIDLIFIDARKTKKR